MAENVSLGEITGIQGNADIGMGTAGVGGTDTVVPFGKAVDFISQAAQQKQDADRFRIGEYQKNLENYFNNFNKIDTSKVMAADQGDIGQQYAQLANNLASNMDVIRNPQSNPNKYAELQTQEAELRAKIAQSAQHNVLYTSAKDFLAANPDLNTTENNSTIENFANAPIDQRKVFSLSTPTIYDPATRAKLANDTAQQKLVNMQTQGKYLEKTEATQYLQDQYDQAWDALGSAQDKSGRPVKAAAAKAYSLLPPEFTKGKSFEDIDRQVGRSLMKQDSVERTIAPNQLVLTEEEIASREKEGALNRAAEMARLREQYNLMLRNQQAKVAPKAADLELMNTATAKAFTERSGQYYNYYDRGARRNTRAEIVPMDAYEKGAFIRQIPDAKGEKQIAQAPYVVIRRQDGLLQPVYDDPNNPDNKIMGDTYTPDKFMRGYAQSYFTDKEIPALMKASTDEFQKVTGSGTVDNFQALNDYLTKTNRRRNFAGPDKNTSQPTGVAGPAAATPTKKLKYNAQTGKFE